MTKQINKINNSVIHEQLISASKRKSNLKKGVKAIHYSVRPCKKSSTYSQNASKNPDDVTCFYCLHKVEQQALISRYVESSKWREK